MAIDFPNSPTVGQIYTAAGKTWQWTGIVWDLVAVGEQPIVGRWRRVANQSAASGTPLTISWDTEDTDPAGMLTVPGTTLTIPSAGVWSFTAILLDQTGVVNARHMALFQVTSSLTGVTGQYRGSGYGDDNVGIAMTLSLAAGDTVRLDVLQVSGAAHNYQARLSVAKVA